jgi:hypothetical protein
VSAARRYPVGRDPFLQKAPVGQLVLDVARLWRVNAEDPDDFLGPH